MRSDVQEAERGPDQLQCEWFGEQLRPAGNPSNIYQCSGIVPFSSSHLQEEFHHHHHHSHRHCCRQQNHHILFRRNKDPKEIGITNRLTTHP